MAVKSKVRRLPSGDRVKITFRLSAAQAEGVAQVLMDEQLTWDKMGEYFDDDADEAADVLDAIYTAFDEGGRL